MEGSIFTKNDVAKQLELANRNYNNQRTWSRLYGNVDLAGQAAAESVMTDFGRAAGDAYRTAMLNKGAIVGSNLITGNKQNAMLDNELALSQAYDSYLQNYRSGMEQVAQNTSAARNVVTSQLMNQAENTVKYANSHIDYLYALWDKYSNGELKGDFFNDITFANFMKNASNEDGTPATNEDGTPVMELINRNELNDILYETVIGPDGTPTTQLTAAGVAFFDNMEHNQLLGEYSFGDYLSETDAELYDWATSENLYNYAPNRFGKSTNDATFRTLVGQESTDEVFTKMENFFGLTPDALKTRYATLETNVTQYMDDINSKNDDKRNEAAQNVAKEISALIDDFGLTEEFTDQLKNAYGVSDINEYITKIINENPIDGFFKNFVEGSVIEDSIYGIVSVINKFKSEDLEFPMSTTSLGPNYKKHNAKSIENVETALSSLIATIGDMAFNKYKKNAADFYNSESVLGGDIQSYDPNVSRHENYYSYNLNDGKSTKLLRSEGYKDTGRFWSFDIDKDKNFKIKHGGKTYRLEVDADSSLDPKVVEKISAKASTSLGRPLQQGDVFEYGGEIYVYGRNKGDKYSVYKVRNRGMNMHDYNKLKDLFNDVK